MGNILLYSLITFLILPIKIYGQWEKMPIGTKLHYKYDHTFVKYNDNGSDSTFIGNTINDYVKIDTIITLSGKNRKLVFFSKVFDPFGSSNFKVPKEYKMIKNTLFDENNCSIYYLYKDAIYNILVSKAEIKKILSCPDDVKVLDESLKKVVNSSGKLKYNIALNTLRKENLEYYFQIGDVVFTITKFKLIKSLKYRKRSLVYFNAEGIDYSSFFGFYMKKYANISEYSYSQGKSSAQILFSPTEGIINSNLNDLFGLEELDLKMKLERIEYPILDKK